MSVRRKSADFVPAAPVVPRQRRGSDLSDKVAMFNKKFHEHHEKQLSNPFSDVERPEGYQIAKLDVNDPNYGRYYTIFTTILLRTNYFSKCNTKSDKTLWKKKKMCPCLDKWIIFDSLNSWKPNCFFFFPDHQTILQTRHFHIVGVWLFFCRGTHCTTCKCSPCSPDFVVLHFGRGWFG